MSRETHTDGGFDPAMFECLAAREAGHFWFEPRNRLLVGLANRYFPKADRYLEIGCGTGFVLAAFAQARPWARLAGSELHAEGLEIARRRVGSAELVQMDAREIGARNEFDLVGSFDVLEHIAEDEAVIRNVYSVLCPGGGFIAAVPQHPFLWSEADEVSGHVRRYSRGELESKLHHAGFEVLFSSSYTALLLPAMMLARFAKLRGDIDLQPSRALNSTLRATLSVEVWLTLKGWQWPFGGSRIVVARKP